MLILWACDFAPPLYMLPRLAVLIYFGLAVLQNKASHLCCNRTYRTSVSRSRARSRRQGAAASERARQTWRERKARHMRTSRRLMTCARTTSLQPRVSAPFANLRREHVRVKNMVLCLNTSHRVQSLHTVRCTMQSLLNGWLDPTLRHE